MHSHQSLTIRSAPAQTLTPAQKKFNSLIKRIERLRAQLQEWSDAEPYFAESWNAQFLPLQQEGDRLQWELAQQLARSGETHKLTKADRETLHDVIAEITQALLSEQRLPQEVLAAVLALHDAHSPVSHAELAQEAQQAIRAQMQAHFDVDLEADDIDLNDPASVLHKLQQAMQQKMEQEDEAAQAHPAQPARPATKAQQRREAARLKKQQEQEAFAQQASQSVQSVFRRLASSLHPDREQDPAERQRKTALMQRATTAYNDNRLLDLLQLQLEVEQIDPQALTKLAEEQVRHYAHVLEQQSQELQMELHAAEAGFKMRYQLDPERPIKPKDMHRIVIESAHFQKQDNHDDQLLLAKLQDAKALKKWLNETRQAHQAEQRMADMMDALFSRRGF